MKKILISIKAFFFIFIVFSSLQAETTKIGVLIPLTGPFAKYGQRIQASVKEFKNENVKFIFEDEACEPKTAITSYKKLSEFDKTKLFIRPFCGSSQNAIAPLIKKNQHFGIIGSSASRNLYEISGKRMLSTMYSIEDEATFLANEFNSQNIKTVSIVFAENAFSRAHEAAFKEIFKGKVINTYPFDEYHLSELKHIALKTKQQKPEALYVPDAFPLMTGLVKELNNLNLNNLKIFSVFSAENQDIKNIIGANKNVFYSYPNIGHNDALSYFPKVATRILVNSIKLCKDDTICIINNLKNNNKFNNYGVLEGSIILKNI